MDLPVPGLLGCQENGPFRRYPNLNRGYLLNNSGTITHNRSGLSPALTWTMSIGAGVSVANLYFIQPLLALIGAEFHIPASGAGALATVTQIGYALGMLLLVPLGDSIEKRKLILIMLALVAAALLATGLAPGLPWLFAASLAVGVTTITPQLIVPFAAHLAPSEQRGRVVGTVMSGLFVGILLARSFSGLIAARFGWRVVYYLAAILSLVLLAAFRALLPRSEPMSGNLSYRELLVSLVDLLRREPILRTSSVFGALAFGAFSGFWTVLPFFLAGPPYHYGSGRVGMFALIGVTGIVVAPLAGRLADRGKSRLAIGCGLAVMLAAYALLAFEGQHLAMLVLGLIMLDLGTTANHISNQSRVYSLHPEARNRLNTVYMFLYFVGGALGSFAGVMGWTRGGWLGFCATASAFLVVALVVFFATSGDVHSLPQEMRSSQ